MKLRPDHSPGALQDSGETAAHDAHDLRVPALQHHVHRRMGERLGGLRRSEIPTHDPVVLDERCEIRRWPVARQCLARLSAQDSARQLVLDPHHVVFVQSIVGARVHFAGMRMVEVLLPAALSLVLLSAAAPKKGNTMSRRASGTFEVKMEPMASDGFPRLRGSKQFHGDLEGTGAGEMLSVYGTVEGSGAYAAIERVTGSLHGRKGSFALVHSGTMRRGGEYNMIIRVVPDSGTEQLAGLAGSMDIVIEGANHAYHFDYTLPQE